MSSKNDEPKKQFRSEDPRERRANKMFSQLMFDRNSFMKDLKSLRRLKETNMIQFLVKSIGPKWYQVLSEPQRDALDQLEVAIYQDILEGRPVRTRALVKRLGIYPMPHSADLMTCVFLGRDDPKVMLTQLYFMTFGNTFDFKETSYCLNAKLMLSAVLYLGLENILQLLHERFRPDPEPVAKKPRPKPVLEPPPKSPYLQKLTAPVHIHPERKRKPPPPLPDLEALNEIVEDPPRPAARPPPPPPPPPPPKKRLPISYCERMAGIYKLFDTNTDEVTSVAPRTSQRKPQSRIYMEFKPKNFGLLVTATKKKRKKLVPPSTGAKNRQYQISGVYRLAGKTVYVIGSVVTQAAEGMLIHGGFSYVAAIQGNVNLHLGYRAYPPPPLPNPCDCLSKWNDVVLEHVKTSKCTCGHRFDYGNEGTYDIPVKFFEKPRLNLPYKLNYERIYDVDEKHMTVENDFKKLWDNDSVLRGDGGEKRDKKRKKMAKRTSKTCLGNNPRASDYLKCALRLMRKVNIAALLPDVHKVPELREWMRMRLFGPHTEEEKRCYLQQNSTHWVLFKSMEKRGYGHVHPRDEDRFRKLSTWAYKQKLNDQFKVFTHDYSLQMYRSHANKVNLLWSSMAQDKFPDKKFREIYFSYMTDRHEDCTIMHPYNPKESAERRDTIIKKRYVCLPNNCV